MSTNDELKKRKAVDELSKNEETLDIKKIKETNKDNDNVNESDDNGDEIKLTEDQLKALDLPTRLKALKTSKKTLSDPIYSGSGCGLIFTFGNGREKQASKDLNNILDEYIDKFKDINNNTSKKGDDFDFDSAFQAELNQIKETSGSKSKYNKYTLKCNGIAFMQLNGIDPIELSSKIFKDTENSKTLKSKEINRIIPIQKTCHLSNLFDEVKLLIDQNFNKDNKIFKYKIEFKSRMNNKIEKSEYIRELAKLVDSKHQVDLDNPELTIIVEIITFSCFISIVSNYNQCKRFNLILLAGLPASNEPKRNKNNNKSNKNNNNDNNNNNEEQTKE